MIDFKTLVKAIFEKKNNYDSLDDSDKQKLFFILNRYMARAFPYNADALNVNGIDAVSATDLWFNFAKKTTRTPEWFYPVYRKPNPKKYIDTINNIDSVDKYILENFYKDEIEKQIQIEKERDNDIIVKKLK